MPVPDTWDRRTPCAALTRAAAGVVAVVLALGTASCTGGTGGDEPAPSSTERGHRTGDPVQPAIASPTETSGTAAPVRLAGLAGADPLVIASAVVPERAAVLTFTDLDRVKQRLGYAELTGEDLAGDRFAFWERARADGAMFTGTRLYDASSVMAIDYGWTAEDVSWEVDYALTEQGCLRAMLCDTAHGYVLGLRRDLDWSVVTESLRRNGFAPDDTDSSTLRSDDPKAPFAIVHLIPELHALAGGNAIGVQRVAEVVAGAPPFSVRIAPTVDRLGDVESLHVGTGCVDLPTALGPDATADDVTAFLRDNPVGSLAPPVSTVVAVNDGRHATVDVDLGAPATSEDLTVRTGAIRSWPGQRTGLPFARVAAVAPSRDDEHETFGLAVSAMPELRAMTLTDEAPWALCPFTEDR